MNGTAQTFDVNSNDNSAAKYDADSGGVGGGEKTEEKVPTVSYFKLYRFATKWEVFLIMVGVLMAILNAFALPLVIIIYGEFTTILVERAYRVGTTSDTVLLHLFGGGQPLTNGTEEENRVEIYKDSISYLILMTISAVIQFITGTISVDIFNYTSLKQVTRIRIRFFQSVLRQDIAWHDGNSGENFGSRITEDIEKIREGISEKVCMCISLFAVFIISVVIAFLYGWKLTLVCIACVPVLITTSTLVAKFQSSLTTKELQSYSNAGSIAEEVLIGIRTVLAFGGEKKESERYDQKLIPAEVAGKRKGMWSGVGEGIMKFVFYASNALAFWYGVTLILDDRDKPDKEYTPAVLMITFFGILVGSDNIARMAPFIGIFAVARGAATQIFKVIDREPKIDAMSKDGKIINYGIKGDIEFRNVSFRYPTRNDVEVLKHFNLKINAGQMIALVGSSGCGKSTTLQLLQRFYDPIEGSVSIDGNDVRKLNISWLRANLAVVGQEPILFATTIAENIRYGKPSASNQEIEAAARASSAHDFIVKLPHGYDTKVGERGALMSGGQKQRIAIARALVQNPKILLLDEATSALDSQSEKLVQDALDNASKGRTTIIISHRLSTIRQADRIVLLEKGKIMEDGTHDELMLLKKQYFHMNQVHAVENFDGNKEIDNAFDEMLEKEMEQSDKTMSKKDEFYHENHFVKQNGHINCDQYSQEWEELDDGKMEYFKLVCRIMSYVKPEIPFLMLASIGALLAGASYPAFAILFGDIYGALSLQNREDVLARTNIICICFLAVGIVTAFSLFLQNYLFTLTGCHLTKRIRSLLFSSMIKQEMGWFDQENNSVGALCTKLSLDAPGIQAAIGQPLAGIFQAISTLVFGLAIAFYYSWKLALVCVSFIPFILGTVLFEAKFMSAAGFVEKTAIENATSIAMEAVSNLRTVASLRQEAPMIHRYTESVGVVEKLIRKKMMFRGIVFSIGQAMPFFAYGVVLFYGGFLVADDAVPYQNIIKVSEGLIFGAMMLGQTLAFAPAFVSAFVAAKRIFRIVDRKPKIKSPFLFDNNRKDSNENTVKYQNVEFAYPKRPDVQILQGLNLEVLSGKTVALVGHSGCGKSTCIQLLQRLYDPNNGKIFVDVDEISNDIVLGDLRSKLGIVSQEPVLFERTIAENIAYGDNHRNVHLSDVIEAAKTANIHNFIMSLPLSYDTCLGSKGTSLSGGQKQRIAIARALVRNPKILLLDEATSALDSQSEKIVQQALEVARCGRTCIIIAHRLTTIQNADMICVLQNGKVVEMGNHESLLAKGGFYYKLYKTQSGNFE